MVKNPSSVDPATNWVKLDPNVMSINEPVCPLTNRIINWRFENQSPSGSSNKMPMASAIWLRAGTRPIRALLTPKSAATSPMIG